MKNELVRSNRIVRRDTLYLLRTMQECPLMEKDHSVCKLHDLSVVTEAMYNELN
jgi:hypothetical protein